MKKKSLSPCHILLVTLSLTISACTRLSGFDIRQDLTTSLEANRSANSYSDWKNSEYNSDAVFTNWRDLKVDSKEVCDGFSSLTSKDLAFFEEEIKSTKNEDLVILCRKELLKKIDIYWAQQKAELTLSRSVGKTGAHYKFPDNTQTRDVSHGYKAVTADLAPKEVVLTFDDGPHPEYTDKILEAMAAVNAKGIFFALGKSVKENPEVLKRVAQGGNAIGSHSIDHKCLPAKNICAKNNGRMLSYSEAVAQIKGGHQAVFNVLGWVDPFFRFPYGETSAELTTFLRENSVGEFFWSVDSEDWKNRTPAEVLSYTMAQIDRRGGGHVLFHDIQRKTSEMIPEFLRQLYFKGYSIVLLQSSNPNDRTQSKLVDKAK